MHDITLPLAVWLTAAWADVRRGAHYVWERAADDRGADESLARLLWIVAGVAIAIAATAVAVAIFDRASDQVENQTITPETP